MIREFFQPVSLNEALKYRSEHEDAVLLAGGTDLVVAIHKDKVPGENIVDLSKIRELKEIQIIDDVIKIGSMVTFTEIQDSKILYEKANILAQAAATVGAPQIRNRGTIGGNICNASPAADMVTAFVCLEAAAELKSMNEAGIMQTRMTNIEDFITGSHKTLLGKSEILTNIIFKMPSEGTKMCFKKIGRRNALAIARLNGACLLKMDNNIVSDINLVLGSATPKPERFSSVECYLTGKVLNDELLKEAGTIASDYVQSQTGMRSSSAYKLPAITKFTAALIEETSIGGI